MAVLGVLIAILSANGLMSMLLMSVLTKAKPRPLPPREPDASVTTFFSSITAVSSNDRIFPRFFVWRYWSRMMLFILRSSETSSPKSDNLIGFSWRASSISPRPMSQTENWFWSAWYLSESSGMVRRHISNSRRLRALAIGSPLPLRKMKSPYPKLCITNFLILSSSMSDFLLTNFAWMSFANIAYFISEDWSRIGKFLLYSRTCSKNAMPASVSNFPLRENSASEITQVMKSLYLLNKNVASS